MAVLSYLILCLEVSDLIRNNVLLERDLEQTSLLDVHTRSMLVSKLVTISLFPLPSCKNKNKMNLKGYMNKRVCSIHIPMVVYILFIMQNRNSLTPSMPQIGNSLLTGRKKCQTCFLHSFQKVAIIYSGCCIYKISIKFTGCIEGCKTILNLANFDNDSLRGISYWSNTQCGGC